MRPPGRLSPPVEKVGLAAHRLGGLLDRLLRGVLPALLGLSQYFNDLQYRHANFSIAYRSIKTIDLETRVTFIVRNQPSRASPLWYLGIDASPGGTGR
jgi:hypothetical protein